MPTSLLSTGVQFPDNSVQGIASNYILRAYTTPATWTKPTGLRSVKVTVIGAGGNGGNGSTFPGDPSVVYTGSNGGGGGGSIRYLDSPAIPGPISVTVGTAPSKTSSFGPLVSATGGTNGGNAPTMSLGPAGPFAGGTGSGGTINFTGGSGDLTPENTGSQSGYAALGFGSGLPGGQIQRPAGAAGINYGGGALGRTGPGTVASGGAGIVIVEEFY